MKNKNVSKGNLSLSQFRQMEVIDLSEGKRLGFIGDIIFDDDFNKIDSIVIPLQTSFLSMFRKNEEILIGWEQIKTIGQDIIIVDTNSRKNSSAKDKEEREYYDDNDYNII